MPNIKRGGSARCVGLTLTAAVALLGALPVHAETIRFADMLRGVEMTEAACAARPETVWVTVAERNFCIRYYLSTVGGRGLRPLVFLRGDALGSLDPRTGDFLADASEARDVDTERFVQIADVISEESRVPAIYLGRVGLDGSSGHHRIRRTVLELNVTNAALEAIKRRHGFEGFHLMGQSGGATLAGGLLARRSDVGCAVLGSGLLAFQRSPRPTGDPATQYFNVADSAAVIVRKPFARIFVVTDPADRKVPEAQQTGFVDALRAAGGRADQFIVQAADANRHGVVTYARTVVRGCLRGTQTEEIEERVQQQVRSVLARRAKGSDTAREPE